MDNKNISNIDVEMKKRSSLPIVLSIVGVVIVAAIILATVVLIRGGSKDKYQEKLDLGKRYLEELDYEQAVIAYEEAIKIDPKNRKAYIGLAEAYHGMGEDDKAVETIERAKDVLEDSGDLKILDRKIKEIKDDVPEENKSERYEELIDRGDKYFEDGDYVNAILCYEDAMDLDASVHIAYSGLFDVYVEEKEYKSADTVIDSGLKAVTDNAGIRELNKCKKRLADLLDPDKNERMMENPTQDITTAPEVPDITEMPDKIEGAGEGGSPVVTPEPVVTDIPEEGATITNAPVKTDVLMSIRQIDNSKYPVIAAYADITDHDGNDIEGLKKKDISAQEVDSGGGIHHIKINELTKVIGEEKISVGIILDKSGSMSGSLLTQVKNAANALIDYMDLAGGDRIEIISFDSYVYLEQGYTNSAKDLKTAVNSLSAQGATALYDAIYAGVYQAYSEEGSKCVIAFTDGEENCSSYTYNDVVTISKSTGIPVYIVGVGSEYDANTYNNLATSCGGAYYSANYNDLETVLSSIYIGLYRDQQDYYVIKYKTSNSDETFEEWNLCLKMSDDSAYVGECEHSFFAEADMSGAFSASYFNIDYVLPFSNSRLITNSDLAGLTLAQLRIARNEIYARHGRQFKDALLNQWFYSKGWYLNIRKKYSPKDFDDKHSGELSGIENKNALFIQDYEDKLKKSGDIFPNATYAELSEYDLALDKPTLKTALEQMKKYSSTETLKKNLKKVKEAIDRPEIKY